MSAAVEIFGVATPEVFCEEERRPEIFIYRKATIALLRRFLKISIETGRLPSMVGEMAFRSHLKSYRPHCFEDAVIFVTDVERCLQELNPFARVVVARVILQEYAEAEAASLLGCSERTVRRALNDALDDLAELLLRKLLLHP
jgi:predicted DNA-binding protein (UPF0251 family)